MSLFLLNVIASYTVRVPYAYFIFPITYYVQYAYGIPEGNLWSHLKESIQRSYRVTV